MLIDRLFDKWQKYIWAESPVTDEGRLRDVWHYRVFCNPAWEPIIPRGEVYSKEFTENGWLSWSDARAVDKAFIDRIQEIKGNG